MSRVPRPGVPVIRDIELIRHEDDIPTSAGARSTRRPPSDANIPASDPDTLLGQVMTSQARVEAEFRVLSAAFRARTAEHQTAMRELSTLGKALEEMGLAQRGTDKTLKNASRFVPVAIVAIEIAKRVFAHYFPGVV